MASFEETAVWLMQRLHGDFPRLQPFHTAAIAGNGGYESGGFQTLQEIRPTIRGSRGGYGWFQWTGPRRKQFEAYCKEGGFSPSSPDGNYRFLSYELRNTEKKAIPALLATGTIEAATKAFELAFERAGVKNYAKRISYAKMALAAYEKATQKAPMPVLRPSIPVTVHWDNPTEPKSLIKSKTIWSTIGAVASSGALATFSYINSVWGVLAFGLLLLFAYFIIRERLRHRREDAI